MSLAAATTAAASPFELRDGDRVAIVGGTFVEREAQFGWIETALTASLNDRRILFRNMGWSGDTVWTDSRGVFDAPEVGYQRLLDLIKEFQPTVVLLAYGQNESFAGEAGLPAFVTQYEKLSSDVKAIGARLVYVTPLPFARPVAPLPDATGHNRLLADYSNAIRELAAKENAPVIDLQTIHWPSDAATREPSLGKRHPPDARGLPLRRRADPRPGETPPGRSNVHCRRGPAPESAGEERTVFPPLAAAELDLSVRFPQTRAGE